MSSDDASSTVTYTSVSSGSSEPSAWEHPEHHDSSEENMSVEDQPDAEDADSHGFLADSDSMEDDTDAGSIDYQ
ncbi:hypothetical protein Tco_0811047 [Tanacetum coccineum]